MVMIITIPGVPIPQPRLRNFFRGGHARIYDPARSDKIRLRKYLETLKEKLPEYVMPQYPLVSFIWYMPIPESWSKKRKAEASEEMLRHIVRPDVDNLEKLALDVLAGIFFENDCSVAIEGSIKVYSKSPRTDVFIREGSRFIS